MIRLFLSAVLLALTLPGSAVVAQRGDDTFILVNGVGYEGAIIPAVSPWQIWKDAAIRNQHVVTDVWTPSKEQVARAESALQRALDQNPPLPQVDVGALTRLLPRMKRHYAGIVVDGERIILLHGFPDDSQRWKTEASWMSDGGCRQFWADFSEPRQRLTWIRCGGLA